VTMAGLHIAGLDALAARLHANARAKGFYDRERLVVRDPVLGDVEGRPLNPSLPAEKLMLIVSEAAEVLDALRDGDRDHEAEEIADVVIRALDYAAWRGFSIEAAIAAKVEANGSRPHLHGRQF
jgi:NTP pyrophosphatase (non-canonical NTP hydrolase)